MSRMIDLAINAYFLINKRGLGWIPGPSPHLNCKILNGQKHGPKDQMVGWGV